MENVLLVENLQANLISVSQLCDEVGEVRFTKTQCVVNDKEGASVMVGKRFNDPSVFQDKYRSPGYLALSVRPHELSRFDQTVQKRMCKRIT